MDQPPDMIGVGQDNHSTPQSPEECAERLKACAAEFNRLVQSAVIWKLVVRVQTIEERIIGTGEVPRLSVQVMRPM